MTRLGTTKASVLTSPPQRFGENSRERRRVVVAPVGQCSGNRNELARAHRQEQGVVEDRLPVARGRPVLRGGDCGEGAEAMPRAAARRERAEVEAEGLTCAERLGHGKRAVEEISIGCQELDVDSVLRKGSEGDHRFQRGDPASGDEYVVTVLTARHDRATHPSLRCRFPAASCTPRARRSGSLRSRAPTCRRR